MSDLGYYSTAGALPNVLPTPESERQDRVLMELLRRCPPATIAAARRFRLTRSAKEIPNIVQGVLGRYVEKDKRELLAIGSDDLGLVNDLALDSLSMIEISMTLEDVLEISLPDEKLRQFKTLGDIKRFARKCLST